MTHLDSLSSQEALLHVVNHALDVGDDEDGKDNRHNWEGNGPESTVIPTSLAYLLEPVAYTTYTTSEWPSSVHILSKFIPTHSQKRGREVVCENRRAEI